MKLITRCFLFLIMSSAFAQAEVWVKPAYKTDENHPPISNEMNLREAQEETPMDSELRKHQEVKKPDAENELKKIDDQLNEGEESNQ